MISKEKAQREGFCLSQGRGADRKTRRPRQSLPAGLVGGPRETRARREGPLGKRNCWKRPSPSTARSRHRRKQIQRRLGVRQDGPDGHKRKEARGQAEAPSCRYNSTGAEYLPSPLPQGASIGSCLPRKGGMAVQFLAEADSSTLVCRAHGSHAHILDDDNHCFFPLCAAWSQEPPSRQH